jgi:hypothetical protein
VPGPPSGITYICSEIDIISPMEAKHHHADDVQGFVKQFLGVLVFSLPEITLLLCNQYKYLCDMRNQCTGGAHFCISGVKGYHSTHRGGGFQAHGVFRRSPAHGCLEAYLGMNSTFVNVQLSNVGIIRE